MPSISLPAMDEEREHAGAHSQSFSYQQLTIDNLRGYLGALCRIVEGPQIVRSDTTNFDIPYLMLRQLDSWIPSN